MSSALWFALALIGQAAALHLIDAGRLIHYQHYRLSAAELQAASFRWALGLVGLQTALVGAGLFQRRQRIAAGLTALAPPWRMGAALAFSLCVAAAVSRDQSFFLRELGFAAFIQVVNGGNIVLAVWDFPTARLRTLGKWAHGVFGGDWKQRVGIDGFALGAAAWVTVISAALAWFVYQHHPHVADEVAYLYNARYFSAGNLVMSPPPFKDAFDVDLMDYQPHQWFSAVPLGWPAVLSIGQKLGAAWLVNAVLGGLNVWLIHLIVAGIYSRRVARICVALVSVSPWYLFLSMSYMTHIATLTCALLGFWGILQTRATGRVIWAFLSGLAVGAATLIRPLDGAIAGLLIAAWALGVGGTRLRWPALVALAAGTLATAAINLPYNKALTGSFTKNPLTAYQDKNYKPKSNAYGFGPERGLGWPIDPYPGHTPFEAVILAELNGHSLNTDLFGWSTGSLFLIAAALFLGKIQRADRLMIAVAATVVLAYAPYWTNGGPDFGARYWFLILVPCLALSARGLERLEDWLRQFDVSPRAGLAVAALCLLSTMVYVPWRSIDKYYHYLRMEPGVRELASEHRFGRSLVLIRGDRFPDYMSAAIYNPLDLHAGGPVYAWDRNPSVRERVLSLYADRPVWIIEGPTLTQSGYHIVAGPLTAGVVR